MKMPTKGTNHEADGNPQPFREFDSITQRHRGGGQIATSALHVGIIRDHTKEAENAEDTFDHDGC
jgi:hypothetical protein